MRWIALAAGAAFVVAAFASATRVADTRDGLIAEVITLFAGLAGVSLLLYGLLAGSRRPVPATRTGGLPRAAAPSVRPAKDLLLGAGGLTVAAILLGGLAYSGGFGWAGLGAVLLSPMIAGSAYLAIRFARAPARDWRLDLRRGSSSREQTLPAGGNAADEQQRAGGDDEHRPQNRPVDETGVVGQEK